MYNYKILVNTNNNSDKYYLIIENIKSNEIHTIYGSCKRFSKSGSSTYRKSKSNFYDLASSKENKGYNAEGWNNNISLSTLKSNLSFIDFLPDKSKNLINEIFQTTPKEEIKEKSKKKPLKKKKENFSKIVPTVEVDYNLF